MNNLQSSGPMAHRAGWILVDSNTVFQNGYVVVSEETIVSIGRGKPPENMKTLEHGPGVLMPPLVNVHTHLELSALKGKIVCCHGFRSWVQDLIRLRGSLDASTLYNGAIDGAGMLYESGCGVVGEISTLGLSREIFGNAQFAGVWFQECIGDHASAASIQESKRLNWKKAFSLAGHGPHTTAPQKLLQLKASTLEAGLPFSIHLAESEDEILFINTGKGPWADLLTERGIGFNDWPIGIKTPVRYLSELGLFDEKTIAVHLLYIEDDDLTLLRNAQVNVCLCLRSNQTLHGRLPAVEKMQQQGLNLCLGTDSLASVDSLSIFDEMAFMADKYPGISINSILQMATCNGAAALGLSDRYGTLKPGRSGHLLYVPVQANKPDQLISGIVHADFKEEIYLTKQ